MMIWQEHYIFFFCFCSSNYSIWEIFILILTRARKVERKKERVFEDRFEKLLKQLERGGGGEGRETKSYGRARTVWIMSVQQGSTLGPHGTLLALAIMRGANRAWPKHESITLDYSTCQAMNWDNTATLRTRIQAWKTWNDPIEGRWRSSWCFTIRIHEEIFLFSIRLFSIFISKATRSRSSYYCKFYFDLSRVS